MSRSSKQWLFIIFVSAAALLGVVPEVRAEFTIGLEVREIYEDNVIGLAADNPNIISSPIPATSGEVAAEDTGRQHGKAAVVGNRSAQHLKKGGPNDIPIPQPPTSGPSTTTAAGGGRITAGDFSTNISLDIGLSHDIGERTSLLLLAGLEHTGYSTYTRFDFTIAALSAGVAVNLTDDLIGKVLLRDAVKKFNNDDRNANAFGGTLSLKERLTPSFWVKGVYDFEQNNADLSFDSYVGNSYSIWAGYGVTAKSSVGVGFGYLTRDFKSTGFRLISKTVSADWTWEFVNRWSMNVGFDREYGDSNIPDSATIDNIYSIGLLYNY